MAVVFALVGLAIGPLIGIIVDRIVERERPALVLRCEVCATPVGAPLPIISWFRRCPRVGSHRRRRYVATDLITASLFAVAGFRFGLSWQIWPVLVVFALFAAMAVTDWEHHLLVDELTGGAVAVLAAAVVILGGLNGYDDGIAPAFAAGAVLFGFLLVAYLIYPPGLGFGDVKLAPTLGMLLGWQAGEVLEGISLTLSAMIVGMLTGAVAGLALRWKDRSLTEEELAERPDDWIPGEVPLGPFLIFGTVLMIALTPSAALAIDSAGG